MDQDASVPLEDAYSKGDKGQLRVGKDTCDLETMTQTSSNGVVRRLRRVISNEDPEKNLTDVTALKQPGPSPSRTQTRDLGQVKLKTSKRFQQIVVATTVFAVFIDVMGTVIVMPALASLCAYAENGPYDLIMAVTDPEAQQMGYSSKEAYRTATIQDSISPHAFKGEKGAWDGAPPFKFSLAMNAVLSAGQFGSAGGSLFFNRMCDFTGPKLPMQVCLFMGIVGYLIIYAAGMWVHSYYLFAIGMLWNNFFGNTVGVASTYFGQLFEGAERDAYIGLVQGMLMIGASIGAFIVMPFANNPSNGENFFGAIWLAIGLTALAFVLVSVVLVSPEETSSTSKEEMVLETPRLAKKMLIITIIASALDSAGDEGTRMAAGTILSNLFPEWSTTARQNYLLLAMIFVAIFAAMIIAMMRKMGFTLPMLAVIGCAATLATQLALAIFEFEAGAYIAVWHGGKLFGFLSTFCSGFLIQELAPKALLGYWNGRNEALTNIASAITPLIFSNIYDAIENVRGSEMLYATAAVSFLATLTYSPLISMMPKKEDPAAKKLELQSLEHYHQLDDTEWSQLPLEIVDQVASQMLEQGKPLRLTTWGSYEKERLRLEGLRERASTDFKYISNGMLLMLADRDRMVKEQENFRKYNDMMKADREAAVKEMGNWIADYLDDAGYANWETQTQVYKAMLLTAFPPLDSLDGAKPDYNTLPVERWEDILSQFLLVMDTHLAANKRQLKPAFGMGTALTALRRR